LNPTLSVPEARGATPGRTRPKILLFAVIGVGNTIFDVALYTVLRSSGRSTVTANLVSASAALVGSYLLNSKLTFKARRWSAGSFAAFVTVTLFGLWVLQTGAIVVIAHLLQPIPVSDWRRLGPLERDAMLAGPKLLATGVTFVWNFCWYNKVIFRSDPTANQVLAALE
jgi:putative flippase GtrA